MLYFLADTAVEMRGASFSWLGFDTVDVLKK